MPKVEGPANKPGDFLVDYEEKVFEDVKAAPGEKALVTFHTVAFEGSIGLVNMLQALRLQRKGFETSVLLYGPGRHARRAARLPEARQMRRFRVISTSTLRSRSSWPKAARSTPVASRSRRSTDTAKRR